ncbi:hypothetical protein OIE52_37605 [Streptomyces canus]|uniref:hypothetical protein n=1 Tax=Streptomyces canus TaxID=58343 RepID=UPI002E2D90B5|nr:hypothetical protein [Streptomyces canus]
MDRKTIKAKLRELAANPGQPGAAAEVQRLKGHLRRLTRTPEPAAETTLSRSLVAPADGLTEADRAAVETWPPELRARLYDRALTRQILPWRG